MTNNNTQFKTIDYFGFEVIIHIPTKTINYTKFCKFLKQTKNHNIFKNMIHYNSKLWDIIISFEAHKIKNLDEFMMKPKNISTLVEEKIFYTFMSKVNPHYFGTYGPEYLLPYLILNCGPIYYKRFINNLKYNEIK